VAASGNVEHDRLLEVLARTGWTDAQSGDASPLVSPTPTASAPTTVHISRDGAQTHIVAGCTGVSHSDPERFPFLLLSTLLGGGMSSRLFQRVREEMGLAYAIYTFQSFHADSGMHGVYVATAPESAGAALDAIRHELRQVVSDGLPADEVAMGRQQLKGQVTLSLESVSSRMYRAASVELYDEPYRTLDEVLALIDAISVDDVSRVARAYFAPERMTVVSLGPKGTD